MDRHEDTGAPRITASSVGGPVIRGASTLDTDSESRENCARLQDDSMLRGMTFIVGDGGSGATPRLANDELLAEARCLLRIPPRALPNWFAGRLAKYLNFTAIELGESTAARMGKHTVADPLVQQSPSPTTDLPQTRRADFEHSTQDANGSSGSAFQP